MTARTKLAAVAALVATMIGAPAVLAQGGAGGGGGGGGTVVPGPCAKATVTNSGQTVRHLVMPDLKYNLENCGTTDLNVTVTVSEAPGFLSVICPSPVAAPARLAVATKAKISSTFPVYRGPCGEVSPSNQTVVQGSNAWQGHNLILTVTDDSTGTVLGTSNWFSWQDCFACGA